MRCISRGVFETKLYLQNLYTRFFQIFFSNKYEDTLPIVTRRNVEKAFENPSSVRPFGKLSPAHNSALLKNPKLAHHTYEAV